MKRIGFVSALAAVLGTLLATAAHALPVNGKCAITTYYAEATLKNKVGSFSTCPGSRGLTGRRTAFFETDIIEFGDGPRPKPPGTKPFPCEFLENCVLSLPNPIVVKP
jgi:hypothetical protein